MTRVLVVHHSPGSALPELLEAALDGMRHPELDEVDVVERAALEAESGDVLEADGILLGTPANFGYMSGALKHFFDRVFLDVGGSLDARGGPAGEDAATARLPFGLYVHGNYDTTGAVRSVRRITDALGWRPVGEPVELVGPVDALDRERVGDLAATLAATAIGW